MDMEYIGKMERQGGMDTVQSSTLADVKRMSEAINKAELLVRINPIHEASSDYISSKAEIDGAIANGAQIVVLPYFKTADEVKLCGVGGRKSKNHAAGGNTGGGRVH